MAAKTPEQKNVRKDAVRAHEAGADVDALAAMLLPTFGEDAGKVARTVIKDAKTRRVPTATPGIYKRGGRYVFSYRDDQGKQRWESARTLAAAREERSARETAVNTGEHDADTKTPFRAYAEDWIERYLGRRKGRFQGRHP